MMKAVSQVNTVERACTEAPTFFIPDFPAYAHREDRPRFLLAPDKGIGDAVAVGLSAIDQIIRNEQEAWGTIDILCNRVQAQIFMYDPRINRVIVSDYRFFPGQHVSQWLRGIVLDEAAQRLVAFLRGRRYEAIHPGIIAPGLYFRLHARIMYPHVLKLVRDIFFPRLYANLSLRKVARQMVDRYFGKDTPMDALDDETLLYVGCEQMQRARAIIARLKKRAGMVGEDCKVLLVASDSASAVTRPPTRLLTEALSEVLKHCPDLIIAILPAYTDRHCASKLWHALACGDRGGSRVFLLPAKPPLPLLELAALLDQADVLVTGDTGVMHLAAATKRIVGKGINCSARNTVKIVALFGGTNPSFYGYRSRSTILGEGRDEQKAFRPGFSKEGYNPGEKNLFDHINPRAVAEAILQDL
ncbi:MAG TPA: glycosyltransferase family 9 protein [Ktedonobacteraceae bacterium]|nr:glycosyltransferase family 9 protein [Ktedonobacteraceae bacterium]